jgi:hypothetical protein
MAGIVLTARLIFSVLMAVFFVIVGESAVAVLLQLLG